MFLTKLQAGVVVLLAFCTIAILTTLSPPPPQDPAAQAGGDGGVQTKGRLFTPDGDPIYVNIYSTDPSHDRNFLYNYAYVNVLPEIKQVRGIGSANNLSSRREYAMRIRLNPDHMRAHNLSSNDIKNAFEGCSMIGSPERFIMTSGQSSEYELTHIGRYNWPEQYDNIVLKATPDGEILRLKDVGQVELGSSLAEISSDIDGHPAAALVLKPAPGSNAAVVIKAVKEKLNDIKKESFPPGVEFEVIPLDSRDMVYAVIQTPRDSTLEFTSATCHELAAIARGIDGITSVSSLAGYQIRTEGRDWNAGTCLIHLKDRSNRKLTTRQIIAKLGEKCRTMNVDVEFFEPPAVTVFVAAGGFSVRVLEKTTSNNDERPGRVPETFVDDLLKRKSLEPLFRFFASNYPQFELVINNDVARQKGVSIASAMGSRFKVVGSDDQAEPKTQRLVEDFSHLSFKNDRGEMVPYDSFIQLKMKRGLNENDR